MTTSLGIWTLRNEARILGTRLAAELNATHYLSRQTELLTNRQLFAESWPNHRQWIFIATTAIAVRYLQGLMKDKLSDPAVVVVDEAGRFAISLLGGHEGGGNFLAYQVANLLGAVPIITTATETLKPLVLGLGCRKNVAATVIDQAIQQALAKADRKLSEVREVATIDLKANEPGLIEWCAAHGLPLRIISRSLLTIRPWVTENSAWVKDIIGVEGVCEPCALLATFRGKLILPKFIYEGVTVALVEEGTAT